MKKNLLLKIFLGVVILYYAFCWFNYLKLQNGGRLISLSIRQYEACEKFIKASDDEKEKITSSNNEDYTVNEETCNNYVIEGAKPVSVYYVFENFLTSAMFFIPFFMLVIVIFPFMYILSKEYNGKYVKSFCLRSKYKNYLKHIYKIAYLNIFTIPVIIFLSFLISFILARGNTNAVVDATEHLNLPNVELLSGALNMIIYGLILFFNSGMYINIGLTVLNRNKKFILSLIESIICIFLVWAFSEIIIGLKFSKLLNISVNNFNLLSMYDLYGVTNQYIYLALSFILFSITGIISYLSCKNKEKFIIGCEK